MIVVFEDGTVSRGSAAIKAHCKAHGLDWDYWRRRSQKGMTRRNPPRVVRLPDDWRSRLDAIFGADAVIEFAREVPVRRPAIVVTPNATDSRWGQALGHASAAMCCVRGRINYVDVATGIQLKGNPRGTILWLFADNSADVRRFSQAFSNTPHTVLEAWGAAR